MSVSLHYAQSNLEQALILSLPAWQPQLQPQRPPQPAEAVAAHVQAPLAPGAAELDHDRGDESTGVAL